MQIIPNQTFKHGSQTYKEGQSYEVSGDEAAYFEQAGWVGDPNRTIIHQGIHPDGSTWLDIHDAVIGHKSEVK